MTEQDQKQLGTTLWGIADTLHGSINLVSSLAMHFLINFLVLRN